MNEQTVDMQDLHAEHLSWKKDLEFYLDDLAVLTHRLEDVVTKNGNGEIMRWVEHYQNQFIRQQEVNDEIRHQINVHEDLLVKKKKKGAEAKSSVGDHRHMRATMDTYKSMYHDLKTEFMVFLTKAL